MTTTAGSHPVQIDRFFAGPGARGDRWQSLTELAEGWSRGSAKPTQFEAALAEMTATEGFLAYPGSQLMAALRDRAEADDAHASAALSRRITRAILTRSYRQDEDDWEAHEEGERAIPDVMPPALGRTDAHRPYFEVLIVTGAPATRWPALGRSGAGFAGRSTPSFMSRSSSAASRTRFARRCSTQTWPRSSSTRALRSSRGMTRRSCGRWQRPRTSARAPEVWRFTWRRSLKRVRPELDLYLVSNGRVEDIAGNPKADVLRRVFYAVEELLELHLGDPRGRAGPL